MCVLLSDTEITQPGSVAISETRQQDSYSLNLLVCRGAALKRFLWESELGTCSDLTLFFLPFFGT